VFFLAKAVDPQAAMRHLCNPVRRSPGNAQEVPHMPRPKPLRVSVTRVIEADANTLYDLVADITQMPKFSPETIATRWIGTANGPAVGARFKGTNRLGRATWSTKPTVIVADRGVTFAFKVPRSFGPEWVYAFTPVTGGTRVTETVQQQRPSPFLIRFIQRRNGVVDRAENLRNGMLKTLDGLAGAVNKNDQRMTTSTHTAVGA
jgi:hypothetical protein